MKDLIHYKGFYGSVHYDPDEPIFYGKLEFIKALVSYEAQDAVGIKKAFEEAVDDYLMMCEHEKIEPEHPFKGLLNVRLGHELHLAVSLAAKRENLSINSYICHILKNVKNRDHSISDY